MGRFARLDFNERSEAPPEPLTDPWPNMDEGTCIRAGDDQFQRGFYEAALRSYSGALRFNRSLLSAWVGQVRSLLCLGEYAEAITWSNRGLERFEDAPDLLACKGLALMRRGGVDEGMEYLDGAVEAGSPSSWVWLARGEALLLSRQPSSNAHRCFLKALELSPDDPHLDLRTGMAYNQARMHAEARRPLLAAVRALSDNPLALYQLGVALHGLGEREGAAGAFSRALALRPDYREAEGGLERARAAGFRGFLRRLGSY